MQNFQKMQSCLLCFVVRYSMSILIFNHIDAEEGAGCLTLFVFLVSRDCYVALPHEPL